MLNFRMHDTRCNQSGFTLVEAIIVMVITGVISAVVAMFISRPITQYNDMARRAELTDVADTAMRRISRDLHLALPNSVRNATSSCIEFIPTKDGGRYRAAPDSTGAGNVFNTAATLTKFDVIGPLNTTPTTGDFVVVYNLGISGADAYASNDNRASIVAPLANNLITINAKQFPFTSPGNRFHLISGTDQAVSYVCSGVGLDSAKNGTGILYRSSAYGFVSPAPNTCANIAANTPIMASNISACQFSYTPGVSERTGLVSIRLSISKGGQGVAETVSLYEDVNVNNVP
jgi:MSHA biogenesis protein MshO